MAGMGAQALLKPDSLPKVTWQSSCTAGDWDQVSSAVLQK